MTARVDAPVIAGTAPPADPRAYPGEVASGSPIRICAKEASPTRSCPQAERTTTAAVVGLHLPERRPPARFRARSARLGHCRGHDRRSRSNHPGGPRKEARQPEKETTMLRTFAVALLAASVLTAPVFAQGNGAAATPPVKAETNATSATPKVVTAKPTLKTAKVK